MKRAKNNFDFIARAYDHLARLIFGKELMRAQCYFLDRVPPESDVLILGGGSGELLDNLIRQNPTCRIWYVEASIEMIELSKKRIEVVQKVFFIHGTENSIPEGQQFNVVITNFYLDLFNGESLIRVVQTVVPHLKDGAIWLVTDFVETGSIIHRILLRIMYRFFRVVSNIEASRLPDWSAELKKYVRESDSMASRNGFIRSMIFRNR